MDVGTEALAAADFLHIANLLHMKAQTWKDACRGLSTVQKPWLLVLDNADDPNTDYQCYFPTGTWGMAIMTSRNAECGQHSTCQDLPLDTLSEDSAQTLLLTAASVPPEGQEGLKGDATAVARLLVSHPLAIIQAGAYISGDIAVLLSILKCLNGSASDYYVFGLIKHGHATETFIPPLRHRLMSFSPLKMRQLRTRCSCYRSWRH